MPGEAADRFLERLQMLLHKLGTEGCMLPPIPKYIQDLTLETMNVTLFGKRVAADEIKDPEMRSSWI